MKIKTTNKKAFFLIACALLFFGLAYNSAYAAFNYQLLESFPGFFERDKVMQDLPAMILAIYKFGIWTVGIAGLFMLVVGGFMYMSSAGNTSTAGSARGIIADALLGIVAALGAYLILYVINPDLTKLNLSLKSATITESVSGAPISSNMKTLAEQILASGNITKNSSGDCKNSAGVAVSPVSNLTEIKNGEQMTTCNATCKSSETPCTGKTTPSLKMLQAIMEVASSGKSFTITSIGGGQHSANSSHYSGKAIDITPPTAELRDLFIRGMRSNSLYTQCDLDGKFTDNCSLANHVHVDFR